ncbi:MAG: TM0106 family RecB-like putative nuclease [Polyangiaceae bacterium]|nr:TM0106 family RecB-like putative nuclease [Polyangiaceae bacterium]
MKEFDGSVQLSATDVADLSACGHLVTLEVDAMRGRRVRPNTYSAVTTRLIKLGDDHERAYLDNLKTQGKTVEELNSKISQEDGAARTLDAMKRGADVIYQGVLHGNGWFGRADFLVRVETPSLLGQHSYEVFDTKLSREAKGRALIQLCLYSQLLEAAQGVLPEFMHIVLGDGTEQRFATRSYLAYFRRVASDVKGAVSSAALATYPSPIEHCDICHWAESCEKQLRDDDDLSLVAGLTSRHREQLRQAGIATLTALGSLPRTKAVANIAPLSLDRIREQARIQGAGRAEGRVIYELLDETDANRGLLILPEPSPGDLFVDIEGDPLVLEGGIEYLIGVIEAGPERGRFTAFWGTDRAKEKRAFEDFMQFVRERRAQDPNLHLYHYAPYEPTAFRRLAARHNTCEDELDDLLRGKVFVDLYRVIRQGVRASVESYSIKKMEALYRFSRRASLRDAGVCLVAMATWFDRRTTEEPPAELIATIAAYNEDDCASTLALRDWLEERRHELQTKAGRIFARPEPGEVASEKQELRAAEVEALERELTASIPDDATLRSAEQQAQWLLAQLLDWHRREDKSVWSEFFRQCELSDEDLVEDPAPLGGLVYEGEAGKEKKSTLHRYRFPPQEFGIAQAHDLVDPRTRERSGSLHTLNEEDCTIVLKRGPSLSQKPHPSALIEKDIVGTSEQKASLMRLGGWVAKNGMNSRPGDFRTERAFLMREPPVIPSGVRIEDARTAEEMVEIGKQLALAVDGSVLPVQGPPGAGKTHLGAEMIVALVRAGKRVGIVANSHKVIGKLLKEACKLAENQRARLNCIQKTDDDEPVHEFVTNAKTNADVVESLEAGANVAAGTAWLWSREEMKGAVDVLFVDEAGQISLANVVACAQAANGLVLLGDPQQLDQPLKGVHPPGAEVSALGHMLGGRATLDANTGIFLGETWRMHPAVCAYVSEVFYEARLSARANLSEQKVNATGLFGGVGLRFIGVEHRGNTNESAEEAKHIGKLVTELLTSGATWTSKDGKDARLTPEDVLVITPYNAQVAELRKHLPHNVAVGTVDKFQGQEAPIAIYSLATSSPEDAPRGMEFLYSKNRLNVAISRARCVSVVVGNPSLFRVQCKTPRHMELANAFCRFFELAERG